MMKTKIVLAALASATLLLNTSCEQHKWSDTKVLFQSHGHEHAGEHGKGDDHGHGKADAHGEKGGDHAKPEAKKEAGH